jgi:hypothetical protein
VTGTGSVALVPNPGGLPVKLLNCGPGAVLAGTICAFAYLILPPNSLAGSCTHVTAGPAFAVVGSAANDNPPLSNAVVAAKRVLLCIE